jgi:putative ABC transport system permease protein
MTADRVGADPTTASHPWRSLARLTWRESRTMRSRLLLYMSSVSLGIGALVAIDSFSTNVLASVADSSRSLLGGDLALLSRQPLAASAAQLADSLEHAGAREALVTTFPSMAALRRSGRTRLAQIRAVSDAYPLVGLVETDPASAWTALRAGERAVVDPSLLATLDARIGDSLTLGYTRFEIVGTIRAVPGDAGIAAAIAPRVFIPDRDLAATQLLVAGGRADYKTLIALRPSAGPVPARWLARERRGLAPQRVRIQTVADAEANLTNGIKRLTDFLGVLGVVALLLGGIGVASGITAFVARKIEAAAILRCLGATGRQVLAIYLTQAAAMGLVGAAIGVLLGVGIQLVLPSAVRDFLPTGVSIEIVPRAMLIGLVTGLWIALLFAIRPLLALRRVSPLQALRRHVETAAATGATRRLDPAVWAAGAAIAATLIAIAVARAPTPRMGIATAVGIGVVLGILWLAAGALAALARRLPRARWPYVVRQGIANLHRPANQTRAVVLALGFGVFLISALALVQSALLHEFAATTASSRANLLLFDVQDDQARATDSIIRSGGSQIVEQTPIVTMRIASINGTPVSVASPEPADSDTTDTGSGSATPRRESRRAGAPRRAGWALRREYRSTYRDTLVSSERLVAGRWTGHRASTDSIAPVSFEAEVAKELGVTIGDRITWDVQGVPVESRITSLRDVDWARFEPNFFAVFPDGVLEQAPKQYVFLADAPSPAVTASLQRSIGERFPNISSVDLSLIRDTVNGILRKITLAIRFLTVFCLLMGIPVLFSAVAATRRDRIRESVLLKTLGASRTQVTRIMVAEYAMLGVLASIAGMILSVGGAWLLVHFVFETPFVPDVAPALFIALASAVLTIVIGVAGSRSAFASTPLEMLRAE